MSLPFAFLDQRPIVIAIAGSNGAGKSTFFETFLSDCGLRFVNADVIAEGPKVSAYEAAEVAAAIRSSLVSQGESFVFETVLSDPVGQKVDTLASYVELGFTVVLLFIRVDDVREMVMEKRQESLNRFVAKITYNDDDGDVDIEMNDEAVARLLEEQAPDDRESEH